MLGQYNLLPLLKGWEYKTHVISRSGVIRGAAPITYPIVEKGWIMYAQVVSDDAYGTINITWQGADLQSTEIIFNAEAANSTGSFAADPGGFVARYFRPNPNSTAGFFYSPLHGGGMHGSAWAYVPTVLLGVSLQPESTQSSATVHATAVTIAITNSEAFIKSLRLVLDADATLKVSKDLLTLGPAIFEEKPSEIKLLLMEIRDLLKRK